MAGARQFLRRKEAPKAKMEKKTIKPANVVHITIAIAMPRIFVEFFLMSLPGISFFQRPTTCAIVPKQSEWDCGLCEGE
jgi:hypothetical protein